MDLGTLGGASSSAYGINDSGQVVGQADTRGGQHHAFLYNDGKMIDLGTLGGANSSAHDINDSGQIVGSADTSSGQSHAFLYSGGKMIDLGTLGGGYSAAYYEILLLKSWPCMLVKIRSCASSPAQFDVIV